MSMMAPMVFAPCLESFYVQCCDNEAARRALIKGVGTHQPLNCLIAARWTWRNRNGLARRIEQVPTKANVADPISRFEDVPGFRRDWPYLPVPAEKLGSVVFV